MPEPSIIIVGDPDPILPKLNNKTILVPMLDKVDKSNFELLKELFDNVKCKDKSQDTSSITNPNTMTK